MNKINRTTWKRGGALAVVLIFGFLVMAAVPAAAAKPSVTKDIEVFGTFTRTCGGFDFQVTFHFVMIVDIVFNDDGSPSREIANFPLWQITWQNLATGKTIDGNAYGASIWDYLSGTFYVIGVNAIVRIPGQGAVLLDVGRIVIDLNTGQIVDVAGPKELITDNPAAICSLLS